MQKKKRPIIIPIIILIVVLVAAFIFTLIMIGNYFENKSCNIVISEFKGNATVVRGYDYIDVYENMQLQSDDTITLTKGSMVININQDTEICLEDGTSVWIVYKGVPNRVDTYIEVTSGAITGNVSINAADRRELVVNSTTCSMTINDSMFRIADKTEKYAGRISVFEGMVDVSPYNAYGYSDDSMFSLNPDREIFIDVDSNNVPVVRGGSADSVEYNSLPVQSREYLLYLNQHTGSESVNEALSDEALDMSDVYLYSHKSGGESDTLYASSSVMDGLEGVDPGEYVFLGNFDQGFKAGDERIEWLVVSKEDGKALLLSRYALSSDSFQKERLGEGESAAWGESSIREWLNSEFYENSFSDEEKTVIMANDISTVSLSGVEETTNDSVFLLSVDELQKYLGGRLYDNAYSVSDPENGNSDLTVYGCEQASVQTFSKESCSWLLRTPENANHIMKVNEYGAIMVADADDYVGVRPAIYVEY